MDPPDKCTCSDRSQESDSSTSESPTTKEKKSKLSLTSLGLNLRRGRSLQFKPKRSKKSPTGSTRSNTSQGESSSNPSVTPTSSKKSPKWGLRFNCTKKEPKASTVEMNEAPSCCRCTCYRKIEEQQVDASASASSAVKMDEVDEVKTREADVVALRDDDAASGELNAANECGGIYGNNNNASFLFKASFIDIQWINSQLEDCDEIARRQRAKEIEQGIDPLANFKAIRRVQLLCPELYCENGQSTRRLQLVCPSDLSVDSLRALFQNHVTVRSGPLDTITGCHTQVDFIHCLVPDLLDITNCSFYWGKMDRYEAERLLDGKPEGTFLLRDSAQEEFLFSVSFRKYGRSLHARIEQWNHKFSFDSHDPGVYTSDTVCGLIEHYKDPSSCLFFEPMLTWPLHRNITFSLQHMCRATIVSKLNYDDVGQLQLPKTLKNYLKEYHYKQKVRVERFDDDVQWLDFRNIPP